MTFKDACQTLFDRYVACYRAGDAAGCASIYAHDAELYSVFGPPALGRSAIEAMHVDWLQEEPAAGKQINVLSAGCDGRLGWCVADFSEGAEPGGISVNVLARQADDTWLITHCSLTETAPDPA